jgi:hypothetical protein
MSSETLTPDSNTRNIAGAVTDDSNAFIKKLRIDDTTKGLKVMIVGGGGAGSVTSVSVATANGFSGTVANATTTPAITIIAGAITPTVSVTTPLVNTTNNAITATANAATVPVTSSLSTVTNNSAATLTITITTAGAIDGQKLIVRILDFSAATQTIAWVNTENSTVTAPTTSNGSTTLPLTVGFMYNNATSKWRCVASA